MKAALLVVSGLIVAFFILGGAVIVRAESATSTIEQLCADAAKNNSDNKPAYCVEYEKTNKEDNPIVATISKVANILAYLAGAVAIIMVMYGGFQFITSDGNSEKVSKGRQTILYASVGLVVIIMSRVLINYAVVVLVR